jgi:hypothetical protein
MLLFVLMFYKCYCDLSAFKLISDLTNTKAVDYVRSGMWYPDLV